MREPTIHVKVHTLKKFFGDFDEMELLKTLQEDRLNRSVFKLDKRSRNSMVRAIDSDDSNVLKFQKILTLKRSVFSKIENKKSKNYTTLLQVVKNATEFAAIYKLNLDKAYNIYIDIALEKIGRKFSLNKLTYYNQHVIDQYKIISDVRSDYNKTGTNNLVKIYRKILLDKGVDFLVDKMTLLVAFVYARQDADSNNATYKDWIEAQFEGLDYLNVVPEPDQLYGENAVKRYKKWILNNKTSAPLSMEEKLIAKLKKR